MTHNFNSLVKFGLGLFMAGSASLMLVGCDKAPSGNSSLPLKTTWLGLNLQAN